MAGQEVRIDRSEDRNFADRVGTRKIDRLESRPFGKGRRPAALPEPGFAQDNGGPGDDEVDRDAGNDLVAALGDRSIAMDQRQSHRNEDGRNEPDPNRLRDCRRRTGGKGRTKHLAFQPDVEDAGALGEEAGKRREHQRHGDADRRFQEHEENVKKIHDQAPLVCTSAAARWPRAAKTRVIAGRNMFSSAPAKRMTRPWMITIMSLEIEGISKAISAPP